MEKRRYLSASQKAQVVARYTKPGEDRPRCGCGCGEPIEGRIHFDHILPLWLGGTNAIDNFAPLKERHHIEKTAKEATTRGKVRRVAKKHAGEYKKSTRKIGGRSSFERWRGMDGTIRTKKNPRRRPHD